uniref:ribosomal protein S10 n=1 Tax=Euplotes cristatus TaxID=756077 RepID=UPI002E764B66|nr:ribosomal protein S10 [Euplotes cristatus]UPM52064.1 ribosomal protein S10 [Euplotes cristatus]
MIWMLLIGSAYSSFSINLRPRRAVLGYAASRIRLAFFFIFNFLLLIFGFFFIDGGPKAMSCWPSSRLFSLPTAPRRFLGIRVKLTCSRRVRFFRTLQRGPMAHRQWSQEQYKFSFFRFWVRVSLPQPPRGILVGGSEALSGPAYAPAFLGYRSSLVTFYRLLVYRFFFFRVVF